MDKDFIVELATDLIIKKKVDVNKLVVLMREFLQEKNKPLDKINMFINGIIHLPVELTFSIYKTALDYYINKYNIVTIIDKQGNIITYNN